MSKYNALIFEGTAISHSIPEYETRKTLELMKGKPYALGYNIPDEAVPYYSRMARIKISMLTVGGIPAKVDKSEVSEPTREVPKDDELPKEVIDQLNELEVPEIEVADLEEEVVETTDELVIDESVVVEEGLDSEISEYLDINYDDSSIMELATKLGTTGVRSNNKKSTVISKIVENSYDEIYRLVVSKL